MLNVLTLRGMCATIKYERQQFEYDNMDSMLNTYRDSNVSNDKGDRFMSDNMDDGDKERPKNLLTYKSKIVGVTFEGRQAVIALLKGKEPLRVRREPENEYDKKAVAVDAYINEGWAPIGYIAKDKNTDIAATLDAGNEVFIKIASVTGGGDKSFGVNIALEYIKEEAKQAVAVAAESVVERELTPKDKLQLAIDEFVATLGGGTVKKVYRSRILGKSTEVSVKPGGHIGLDGYLSGSAFPKKFYPVFDEPGILDAMVEKHWATESDEHKAKMRKSILSMWGLNRDASTGYGTAIHAALENYDTYHTLGDKLKTVKVLKTKTNVGPNKALSRNPFLKKIVEDFHEKFGGEYIRLSEQFVWLHDKKLCGSIDRIKVIDAEKKIVRIQDFKTDGDIHEKTYQVSDSPFKKIMGNELLDLHWLQLSFYAYILQQYGYTVEGLDVYWLNPEKLCKGENAWEEFSGKVIDISGEF